MGAEWWFRIAELRPKFAQPWATATDGAAVESIAREGLAGWSKESALSENAPDRRDMRPDSGRARERRGTAVEIVNPKLSEIQDGFAERLITYAYETLTQVSALDNEPRTVGTS